MTPEKKKHFHSVFGFEIVELKSETVAFRETAGEMTTKLSDFNRNQRQLSHQCFEKLSNCSLHFEFPSSVSITECTQQNFKTFAVSCCTNTDLTNLLFQWKSKHSMYIMALHRKSKGLLSPRDCRLGSMFRSMVCVLGGGCAVDVCSGGRTTIGLVAHFPMEA